MQLLWRKVRPDRGRGVTTLDASVGPASRGPDPGDRSPVNASRKKWRGYAISHRFPDRKTHCSINERSMQPERFHRVATGIQSVSPPLCHDAKKQHPPKCGVISPGFFEMCCFSSTCFGRRDGIPGNDLNQIQTTVKVQESILAYEHVSRPLSGSNRSSLGGRNRSLVVDDLSGIE